MSFGSQQRLNGFRDRFDLLRTINPRPTLLGCLPLRAAFWFGRYHRKLAWVLSVLAPRADPHPNGPVNLLCLIVFWTNNYSKLNRFE
jgi:hypothetical protein